MTNIIGEPDWIAATLDQAFASRREMTGRVEAVTRLAGKHVPLAQARIMERKPAGAFTAGDLLALVALARLAA